MEIVKLEKDEAAAGTVKEPKLMNIKIRIN